MTESHLSTVVTSGDYYASLLAIRDVLASDIDDANRAKHSKNCVCLCGVADLRARVAVAKELRAVLDAIDALPVDEGVSRLDRIAAGRADEVAARRARRVADAAGS